MNKKINSEKLPAAVGPYSQAVEAGNILFCSGTMPIDPVTNVLAGEDIESQARQVMVNIKNLLEDSGYTFDDVVKTTCFLKDMNDFAVFNGIYAEYFTSKPARSCVAVKELPKGAVVEVELIAVKQ